jgi:hypothetical protein
VTTSHRELVSGVMHVSHLPTNHNLADPRSNWTGLSQAPRDAAYDNNAAVKNSAALIAERNAVSEKLRASRKSFLHERRAEAKAPGRLLPSRSTARIT